MNGIEQWRDIEKFVGSYQVSDCGRVRSLERRVLHARNITRRVRGRILRSPQGSKGYPCVDLRADGVRVTRMVHGLVLEGFVGKCPPGMQACHGDNNRANDRLDNLRWDTPKVVQAKRVAHGTTNRGERCGRAKLTEADVERIRDLGACGETHRAIGPHLGVGKSIVGSILRGENWAHRAAATELQMAA